MSGETGASRTGDIDVVIVTDSGVDSGALPSSDPSKLQVSKKAMPCWISRGMTHPYWHYRVVDTIQESLSDVQWPAALYTAPTRQLESSLAACLIGDLVDATFSNLRKNIWSECKTQTKLLTTIEYLFERLLLSDLTESSAASRANGETTLKLAQPLIEEVFGKMHDQVVEVFEAGAIDAGYGNNALKAVFGLLWCISELGGEIKRIMAPRVMILGTLDRRSTKL